MGSEWIEVKLGDFAPFNYGKGLPKRKRNPEGGIPVYGSNGITGYHDEALIEKGIIIGRKGSIGEVEYSEKPFWPIDTTFYVEDSPDRDIRFTYYLLKSLPLQEMNSDSAVPGLNRNAAHNLRISVPDLKEQKRIAHILGTLDDKIELNQRMNQTLEDIARVVFKSWFVDFDPVCAKMAGEHYPLPDEIMALFPDELVDSELGMIPKGWEVGKINDFGEIITGKTPSTKISSYYNNKDIPFIKIPDMHDQLLITSTADYLSKKGADSQSNKYLPENSICVSCIATPGLVSMTTELSQTNQQINSIVPHNDNLTFYLLLSMVFKGDQIRRYGSGGSVVNNLNRKDFSNILILDPDNKVIKKFNKEMENVSNKIILNQQEILFIKMLRDTISSYFFNKHYIFL
jgi:type I restriction enzyme S subunit